MTSFTIRRAEASDAASLAEIAAQTFAETFAADNSPEDLSLHLRTSYSAELQRAEILDADVVTLLAFQEEELVGFAQVRRKAVPDCVRVDLPVELHRLYFVRRVHGQGLAAAMMTAARNAARELGGQHIWLGVWERNPRAIAFYVKSGFVKVGEHVFVVGSDRQTDWVFVSPLSTLDASAP